MARGGSQIPVREGTSVDRSFVVSLLNLECPQTQPSHLVRRGPSAFWIGCVYNGVFLSECLGHDPTYARYSAGTYLLIHVKRSTSSGLAALLGRRGKIYLYAPTWTGMRVKAIRTAAAVINSGGKRLLKRAYVADRIMKLWHAV